MRIQQKTLSAGPDGVFQPGSIREVDTATGRYMIAQGIAIEVKGAGPTRVETATIEPAQEQATAPQATPPRRKRRRGEPDDNN